MDEDEVLKEAEDIDRQIASVEESEEEEDGSEYSKDLASRFDVFTKDESAGKVLGALYLVNMILMFISGAFVVGIWFVPRTRATQLGAIVAFGLLLLITNWKSQKLFRVKLEGFMLSKNKKKK